MADPLASKPDVEAALGRALTEEETGRVAAILLKASELFRLRAQQEFTPGSSVVRLKVNGGRVYLAQRPATEIRTVVDDDGNLVDYTQRGQWLDTGLPSDRFVTVDYSHGGVVPDLVRVTVAEVAKRVLSIPADAVQGVSNRSETAGTFTEQWTYAGWAQGGQTMLAPDELAVADSFRPRVPGVIVQGSW